MTVVNLCALVVLGSISFFVVVDGVCVFVFRGRSGVQARSRKRSLIFARSIGCLLIIRWGWFSCSLFPV